MVKHDERLSAAKRAYRRAAEEGNRQEEARWANVIGNILKNSGEYVNSLEWFRKDYDLSIKYLPEKHLLPTCQSLGEIYLRRHEFEQALIYQRKHLELAQDSNDLIEQQRASTQLGRTYHEIFLKSEADPYAIKNAKKYFKSAMELAQKLVRNSPSNKSNFIKEYIDAHNNIGMLEMDLDNLVEAQEILTKGLKICDEEEVIENDDGRTRLHHNLGNVYMELRKWDKARIHIEKDISICSSINHLQGEAKGYINLGELHYRSQKYEEAIKCYLMALDLSNRLEGEKALTTQIKQNIETVEQAIKVNEELKIEEQNLKKIVRKMTTVRGTSSERKCLLQQSSCLDRLIEKSSIISSWARHRVFAKEKKKVAEKICNKEKIADSYLCIGESYQKLRNFKKARKWYNKSWKIYNSIGNLEGQALANINIGDVLDCDGDFEAALNAFKEGYRIAVTANLPSVQLSALENMHYSYMIRFENVEEARKLQSQIEKLKQSNTKVVEQQIMSEECCSETETEEDSCSPKLNKSDFVDFNSDLDDDDTPLISLLNSKKKSLKTKAAKKPFISIKSPEKSTTSSQSVGRKRVRVILSDDDDDEVEDNRVHRARVDSCPKEDVATSDERVKSCGDLFSGAHGIQHVSPVNLEESMCSYKSSSSKVSAQDSKDHRFSRTNEDIHTRDFCANGSKTDTCAFENPFHACYNEPCQHVIFKIEKDYIHVDPSTCLVGDMINIESMKVEVACLYYLRLSFEKRSRGLLPIIQNIRCGERVLQSLECIDILKDSSKEKGCIELSIDVWVPKRFLKLYVDSCKELSEPPNMKLLKRLYKLEVSEDEIIVSDCELQDISITPLFNALHLHKNVALLDLSHNSLGNQTMEKLQQVFTSSSQKYGGLVLDLHCNRLGPSALFQICECPVLFSRLEVLNISQNRLTDACSSYLSTILQNCKGLYSLNIEQCSITSRTIQKIADSLDSGSALTQICIGHNHPISGNALVNLMTKLVTFKRFSELNLNGLKLSRPVLDSVCHLAKTSCLSELMLGNTNIGMDGALHLMDSLSNESQELIKLDLSYCGLTRDFIFRLNTEILFFTSLLELNLGGNPIMHEGGNALAKSLTNPGCSLRVLLLSKCRLGLPTILLIIQSLANNSSLEELNLSENTSSNHNTPKSMETLIDAEGAQQDLCSVNAEYDLQVPDSDDDDDSRTISSNQNCSNDGRQFTQDFSSAIADATQLQLLDLSKNGFSEEDLTMFYASWSSGSRDSVAIKHVNKEIVHFSVEANRCCNVKLCCRKI